LVPFLLLAACGPAAREADDILPPTQDATIIPISDSSSLDDSQVYAHSGTTLFRVDAATFQPVMIGVMTGLGTQSLTDLAVDKNNHMVGITLDKLYNIDPTTAQVTLVKNLTGAAKGQTSLSFVPSDLNDPNSTDILVAANDQGDVFQIDTVTGDATMIGSYGTASLGKVISSGDLIGVRGLGIFATVDVGTEPNDYLATIDPVTWQATPLPNPTGFNNIFGLGFWAGTIYGFVDDKTDHTGKIITIDPHSGVGTVVDPGPVEWFGAGVTTNAPIIF